ncbi:RNA-binding protein [Candidatus Clostridium stratigraminis]|uniref:RNA-binding protein n=1 Tax=Candidatus Clostridium stratigraminis TaxID=3381661 RepID=A0ABW8T2Y1_9CLOT
MDKKIFINSINFEDKNLLSNLYNKINLAEKINKIIYSNEFLPPSVWKAILNMKSSFHVEMDTCGIFEDSERKLMAFSKAAIETADYPVELIKIINKSKFRTLEHKDYLGALMALGIKREKFGDMILSENCIFTAACADISEYINQNLSYVGKCPCEIEIIKDINDISLTHNSKDVLIKITSLRLDCVVSSICGISRAKAALIIDSGKVLLNYAELREKDKNVEAQDILTIRGYGKYKILEIQGTTQKGKLKLSIKKYI